MGAPKAKANIELSYKNYRTETFVHVHNIWQDVRKMVPDEIIEEVRELLSYQKRDYIFRKCKNTLVIKPFILCFVLLCKKLQVFAVLPKFQITQFFTYI